MSRLDPESSQSGTEDQSKLIGQLREQIATLSVQSAQTRPDHLSGSSQDNSKIKEVWTPQFYFRHVHPKYSVGIGIGKYSKRKGRIVQSDNVVGIKVSFTDIGSGSAR